MHYVFDIDGTICTMPNSESTYEEAEPIIDRIEKINALFDTGNRGMRTFKNDGKKAHDKYYSLTYDQLNNWGVKFHRLIMGKPSGDLYVDDKGVKDEEFFAN